MIQIKFILFILLIFLVLFLLPERDGFPQDKVEVSLLTNQAISVEIKYNINKVEPFLLSQIDNSGPWYAWGMGIDYELLQDKEATLDIGIVWLDKVNRMNGTQLNSHFELQHKLTNQLSLSLSHISHGSKFGIEPNRPNRGWNWVGLTWRW